MTGVWTIKQGLMEEEELLSRHPRGHVRRLLPCFHNEQSAGYTTTAYVFLTGHPSIFFINSGPSYVHCLADLSNTATNTCPAVMVSGSYDQANAGKSDFQELDQLAAVIHYIELAATAVRSLATAVSSHGSIGCSTSVSRRSSRRRLRKILSVWGGRIHG